MKLIFQIAFITGIVVSSSVFSDQLSEEMLSLGFVEKEIPKVGSDSWYSANHSTPPFYVSKDTSLEIRKATKEEENPSQVVFEAKSVKYIGIDHGEFGGGLYIGSYKRKQKPFFEGNIRALVPLGKDLYIVSGLAHLGSSRGAIDVIRNYEKPSEPERVTLLPDAPSAIYVEESQVGSSKFVIAGHGSLMIFEPDHELRILVFNAFWSSLYPSSIVPYKNSYILAIRSGLAIVEDNYFSSTVRYFVQENI